MQYVTLERHAAERVGVVTLSYRGENRFHPDLVAELTQVLDDVEPDEGLGALVVTGGDPKFFSNGLDLEWLMAHVGDTPAILKYLQSVNQMFRRVTLYPKPLVAALNGHTFAAGVFLAAHMDFRFMRADRGWVCLPEVDIDIPLLPGMIAICQAVMTPPGFRQLYYTGRRVNAAEAMAFGFVDATFPAEELLPRSIAFAADLARKRTATYAEMKRRVRSGIARTLEEVDPQTFLNTLAYSAGRAS